MDPKPSNDTRSSKQQIPLSPLTELPVYANISCYGQPPATRKSGRRRLLGLGRYHDNDHNDDIIDDGKKCLNKNNRVRLLLGVLGCPLAPISVNTDYCSVDFHYNIKDIPIERSTAQYIIQQYLAATGCLKMTSTSGRQQHHQPSSYYKNMYTTGTVKMMCRETEISSVQGHSVTNSGEDDDVDGCFVLWQMVPGMWSIELALSCGNKVLAGSDGDTVWSHTPTLGTQVAKGPQRPLRRIIQGLDPKSTASLFAKAERLGDKRIGEEECFVLKACATREDVTARNYKQDNIGIEVLRHVLYGYFSQKSGLLVYMEDSLLTRAMVQQKHDMDYNSFYDHDHKIEEVMYWETSIGSSIGDYKEVDGLMVAHKGRSIATVFGFPDFCSSIQVQQQPDMYRTRFEELWKIDDVAFNIPGLSSHSFLPPSH